MGRHLQETHINSIAVFILENYQNYKGEVGASSGCTCFGCTCHILPSGAEK